MCHAKSSDSLVYLVYLYEKYVKRDGYTSKESHTRVLMAIQTNVWHTHSHINTHTLLLTPDVCV